MYLSPELVVLALLDDFTTLDEKQEMAVTLHNTHRPHAFATGKPGQPEFCPLTAKLTNESHHSECSLLNVRGCCFTISALMQHGLRRTLHYGHTVMTLSPAKDSAMI